MPQHHIDVDLDSETYEAFASQAREQGLSVPEFLAETLRVVRFTGAAMSRRYAALVRQEHGAAKVKVREFKDGLSAYLDRASAGEPLVIQKGNDPSAMLVPLPPKDRRPGALLSMMSSAEGRGLLSALERGLPEDEAEAGDDPSWLAADPAQG
jgi:antitoxin (DNA-binding transcriptional repressor) of toxin-antitoxin stability system